MTDAAVTSGNQVNASSTAIDLAPLADQGGATRTRLPRPGSPAINAGRNDGCPTLDPRGYARGDATCDVGAVEASGVPPTSDVFADGFECNVDDGPCG